MRWLPSFCFVFFALYFLLISPTPTCAQEKKEACRNASSTTTTSSGKANTVVAPSLADDWLNSEIMMQKLMPPDINKEINEATAASAAVAKIGVEPSFLSNLLCSVPFLGTWLGAKFNYCPQDLSIAGEFSEGFLEKSKSLAFTSQPQGLETSAEEQDCFIADDPENDKKIQGNTDIDELSVSLGTHVGVYGNNIPKLEGSTPDKTENLRLNGKTFEEDKRVPEINERCKDYSKANYPDGISICE